MATRQRGASVEPVTFHIRKRLSAALCVLLSDPDERSELLERKLRTEDPARMAEVVRDLAWRQRRGRANGQDLRLLRRADQQLVRWLAAQTDEECGWTRRRMWGTVERTISLFIW